MIDIIKRHVVFGALCFIVWTNTFEVQKFLHRMEDRFYRQIIVLQFIFRQWSYIIFVSWGIQFSKYDVAIGLDGFTKFTRRSIHCLLGCVLYIYSISNVINRIPYFCGFFDIQKPLRTFFMALVVHLLCYVSIRKA